ncbi:Hpt domain-containing protein [Segetibacter koreensis]|uniref:Hpt domain-containing protein n=1 Tax=Segetibacter koreensis TaxID=398037 RepID=UPI00036D313F|nr:Hpt domain-containing protein [Segetibacter koreensis]
MITVEPNEKSTSVINNLPHIIASENVSIDISMLYEISGNDESFIITMLQTFLRTMPGTIKKMEEALDNQDWENVYRSAHFAKSSLSIIKIGEMFDTVVQAELIAKNETDLDLLPGLIKEIKEKYFFAEVILNERILSK